MDKLTMPWIKVFRSIMQNKELTARQRLLDFNDFCDQEEEEINRKWGY